MALVDYEAAWQDLAALVLSREGWGSKALAAEMTRIAAEHQVSETFLERSLRLYGDRITLVAPQAGGSPSGAGGSTPTGPAEAARSTDRSEEDHDGRQEPRLAREPAGAHAS